MRTFAALGVVTTAITALAATTFIVLEPAGAPSTYRFTRPSAHPSPLASIDDGPLLDYHEYNDDGMLTTDPHASVGNYPPACVSDAYCDPVTDSTCTILHVAIDINGFDAASIMQIMIETQAFAPVDLTDCPQWQPLWDTMNSRTQV